MDPKHILVFIDKLSMDGVNPSCITQGIRGSHQMFRDRGMEVSACTIRGAGPAGDHLRSAGIVLTEFGMGPYSPSILSSTLGVLRQQRIDLVHCHGYNAANFGRLAGRRCGVPVVVHEHAVLRVRPHQFMADLLLRNLATAGVAVSGAVKEFMVRKRCVPRDKVRVIHNGIDYEAYRQVAPAARDRERERLAIPPDHRVVGTVTRLREEKGNRYLIEAAARVVKQCPKTTFLVVGDGPLRGALESLADRFSVRDRFVFAGFVDNVPAVLSLFDVAVVPSLREGFSYAAVEAMANGRPIVASRVGGLAEIIRDGANGLHVPPADADALSEAVIRVLTDSALAARLSDQGQREVSRYSLAAYVEQISGLYSEVLAAGGK